MKKIMIIDSSKMWNEMLYSTLTNQNYQCIKVQNTKEIIKMYDTTKPDLVLMETTLQTKVETKNNEEIEVTSEIDTKAGIQYSEQITHRNKNANIIILALSIQPADIISLLTIGVQDIIHKHSLSSSQKNDILSERIKESFLTNKKYDITTAKLKISNMQFNSSFLNQAEIDNILNHSRL